MNKKDKGEHIAELLREGELNFVEIAKKVGCAKSSVTYHAKRLQIAAQEQKRYDWAEVQRVCDQLGNARKTIAYYGMSSKTWNDAVRRGDLRSTATVADLEKMMEGEHPITCRRHFKLKLLDAGLLEARCYADGCTITDTWNGKPITLQLDHINGNSDDNRLENLRMLCPNCHSQTETFGGRNTKKKKLLESEGVGA